MSALVTYVVLFSNLVTFCSRAMQFVLQVRMTAALNTAEAIARQLAPIVSVAVAGSAMRNAVVDEASNTDAGRQQNKDLRCDSP